MSSSLSRPRPTRTAHGTGRLARRVTPSCRGGVSSLLRLTPTTSARLPSTFDLSGWVSRAAGVLTFPAGAAFAPSELTSG